MFWPGQEAQMEETDSIEVPKVFQVCSLFKAAFKLLDVNAEDLEDAYATTDDEVHAGDCALQESIIQDAINSNQKFVWLHEHVLLLLELYRKVEYEFYARRKRHGVLWDEIASALCQQCGLNVTGLQCQQKISGLKRTYANIKDDSSSYCADEWPYYSIVEELFGEERAIASGVDNDNGEDDNPETCTSDMDKKKFFLWPHEGVLTLLGKFKEVELEFSMSKKRHSKIWNEIAEAIQAVHSDLKVTGIQCQQKISGMKRTYWSIKENHPCPNADTVPWPYYKGADEIFNRKRHGIAPETVHSSIHAMARKEKSSSSFSPGNDNSVGANVQNKRNFSWTSDGVLLLLEQYGQVEHEFLENKKRHSKIWNEIAAAIQAVNGDLKPTGIQCQQKISGLKRTYLTIKENHPCPNAETVSWPYFTVTDEIFGNGVTTLFKIGHSSNLEIPYCDDSTTPKRYASNVIKRNLFPWLHEGVLILLEQFKEAQQQFALGEKRHHKIWDEIAARVQAICGLQPTGLQCQQKINTLKRTYVAIKENHPRINTNKSSWPYFSVMDEIFGNKSSMPAPTIACSAGPEMLKKARNFHSSSSDDCSNTGIRYNNSKKNMYVWHEDGIFLLLKKYKEVEHEFLLGNKLHTKIWEQIAAAVCELTNLKVTGIQCLQKLCRLKRIYKCIKESSSYSSDLPVTWPYFYAMDEIFAEKARTAAPAIACSSGPDPSHLPTNISSSSSDDDDDDDDDDDYGDDNLGTGTNKNNKQNQLFWPDRAVFLLLEEYKNVKHKFSLSRKWYSQVWDEIAKAIQTKNTFFKVTGVQCEQKLCGLKQTYATIKESQERFCTKQTYWPFFSVMDKMFGNQMVHNLDHSVIKKRKIIIPFASFENDDNDEDEEDRLQTYVAPVKKRKDHTFGMPSKNIVDDLEPMRLEQDRKRQEREERKYKLGKMKMKHALAMHQEKMQMHRDALDILKEILAKQ